MIPKLPTPNTKMSSNRNSMKSQSKTSSNGNKYAVLEEKGEKVSYSRLWEDAIELGLIHKDRESKKEYYHMVYRKSLIQAMDEYSAAKTDKARKELSDKFEENLARECKKKKLWDEGLKEGMIYECYGTETHYYTSYKLEDLEKHSKIYSAMKDEDKRALYAVTFEKTLKDEKPEVPVKRPAAPVIKGPSFSNVVAASNPPAFPALGPQPVKQVVQAPVQQESPLAKCWQRGLSLHFIHPRNVYHQGLLGFITTSELEGLLKEFTVASPATKAEMAVQFMEELDTYEKEIRGLSKSFTLNRSYADLWKKAATLELIPEDVDYNPEYAEWITPHDLASACHADSIFNHRKQRLAMKEAFREQFLETVASADGVLALRKSFFKMKTADLIKEANTNRPSTRQTTYAGCESCNSKLVHNDLALALCGWIYLSGDQESGLGRARYLRWHNYRKHLHSECSKD